MVASNIIILVVWMDGWQAEPARTWLADPSNMKTGAPLEQGGRGCAHRMNEASTSLSPPAASKRRIPVSHLGIADPHQLFDDTSSAQSQGYGAQRGPSGLGYPTASASPQAAFLADPVSNMAMAYGSSLAAQGKELVDKNVSGVGWWEWGEGWGQEARASGRALPPQIDRFIPVTKLKYYFAVDTLYVGKKLGLLFFPYLHQVRAPPAEVAARSVGGKDGLWEGAVDGG